MAGFGVYLFIFRILCNKLDKSCVVCVLLKCCLPEPGAASARGTGAAAQGSFKSDTHVCKVFNVWFLGQSVREFKLQN